ncbi:MAG: NUDIX hydrolase [Rhodoglobus sp.]
MKSSQEHGWATVSRELAYRGRTTLVNHTVRLNDGSEVVYEVDQSIPFAVATLVLDGEDVLLARQYRYPLRRWIFDLPGGAGREGEEPIAAAQRELEEELGIIANDLRPLHTFSMNPGRYEWPVHIFLSASGTQTGIANDGDPAERVRLAKMSLSELDRLIAQGDIIDPTLLVARAIAAASGALPPLGTTLPR